MPTVLITGANRGIGLEFVRQYLAEGWQVHACCRSPDKAPDLGALASDFGNTLTVHRLDVSDKDQIARLAQDLAGTAIDVLINNAGVFGPKAIAENNPAQTFGHIDYEIWQDVLATNTFAPIMLAEALLPHVLAGEQKKIASISSTVSSIAETEGGNYAYRTSKAALNMAMASLAKDLSPQGISVGIYCPGWVLTDMGGAGATVTPKDSVSGLRSLIAGLTPETSGRFQRYNGDAIPW